MSINYARMPGMGDFNAPDDCELTERIQHEVDTDEELTARLIKELAIELTAEQVADMLSALIDLHLGTGMAPAFTLGKDYHLSMENARASEVAERIQAIENDLEAAAGGWE